MISPLINFSDLGGVGLGTLGPGTELTNIHRSGLTFTVPPPGCYYVSLALSNGVTLVDLFTLSRGGNGKPNPTVVRGGSLARQRTYSGAIFFFTTLK